MVPRIPEILMKFQWVHPIGCTKYTWGNKNLRLSTNNSCILETTQDIPCKMHPVASASPPPPHFATVSRHASSNGVSPKRPRYIAQMICHSNVCTLLMQLLILCKLTIRESDTSDPRHFGPKTLRHQCRTVRKTYRHWCRSVQTLRHRRCRSVWTLRHRPGTNNNTVVHTLFLHS